MFFCVRVGAWLILVASWFSIDDSLYKYGPLCRRVRRLLSLASAPRPRAVRLRPSLLCLAIVEMLMLLRIISAESF
jgi:hypothetical protein